MRWCDASQQKGPGLESTGGLSVWSLNILSNFLPKSNDMKISLTGDSKLAVAVNVCFWELKQSLATDIRLDKLGVEGHQAFSRMGGILEEDSRKQELSF